MSLSQLLKNRISVLADRQRRLSIWCRLATCWAAAGLFGLALAVFERQSQSRFGLALPLVFLVAGVSLLVVVLDIYFRKPIHWRALARQIEKNHPDLDGRLLTAVEQEAPPGHELNFLHCRLFGQA